MENTNFAVIHVEAIKRNGYTENIVNNAISTITGNTDKPFVAMDSTFQKVCDVLNGLCEMNEQEEIKRLYYIRRACKEKEKDKNEESKESRNEIITVQTGSSDEKRPKRWPHPTPKILEEHIECLIATEDGSCKVYTNGFAVYTNMVGRKTVLWTEDCAHFQYHFAEVEGEIMPSTMDLDEDFLGQQPWYIVIALRGEHKIEHNRFSGRTGRKNEGEYEEGLYEEEEDEKWFGTYRYEGPEMKLEKKEMFQEFMEALPEKQREVCIAYHILGFNQEEIGEALGISRQAVGSRLKSADLRLGKKGIDFLERFNNLAELVDGYLRVSFWNRLMEIAQHSSFKYRIVKRKAVKKE